MSSHFKPGDFRDLETLWHSLGIEPGEPDSDGTIAPGSMGAATTSSLPGVDSLPRIRVAKEGTPRTAGAELEMGATIGKGGMGAVYLARQVPLGREVAVKRAHSRDVQSAAVTEILREARVVGALEHPNIVPVHALGRSEEGAPLFVMKRIDGVTWREIIADPDHPVLADDPRDPIAFHLEVLMEVCRAVHFAHSKGILHRDLKPGNVMIGRFGEVYVLDWGLAVGLRDDLSGTLRLAQDVREVAGTPQCMAPEMVAGDGAALSERTDVYLLGAMLHECLTGQSRHAGRTTAQVLITAFRSAPVDYPASVPTELAQICNRATAADPAARFASAEALRRALDDFLRHRASSQLTQEASRRVDAIEELMASAAPRDEAFDRQLNALFLEARFGFRQAEQAWPESRAARAGLDRTLAQMVRYHVARGEHRAAAAGLAEMREPSAELSRSVSKLAEEAAREREKVARLEQLARDQDVNVGRRARYVFLLILAVIYSILPLGAGLVERFSSIRLSHVHLFGAMLGLALLAEVFFIRALEVLATSEINRRVRLGWRVFYVVLVAFSLGGALLAITPRQLLAELMLLIALFGGVVGAYLDRRILPAAAVYLVGFFVGAVWPAAIFEILAAVNVIGTVTAAAVWRRDLNLWPEAKE